MHNLFKGVARAAALAAIAAGFILMSEHATFAKKYNEEIMTVHNAIEGLQKKFEDEMLAKFPTASVDKNVNYNFVTGAFLRSIPLGVFPAFTDGRMRVERSSSVLIL